MNPELVKTKEENFARREILTVSDVTESPSRNERWEPFAFPWEPCPEQLLQSGGNKH